MWANPDGGTLYRQKENDRQAAAWKTAGDPAEATRTHARSGSGDGEVVAVGRARVLQLPRDSRQWTDPVGIPRCGEEVLVVDVRPPKPNRPYRLEANGPAGSPVDSQRPHHPS